VEWIARFVRCHGLRPHDGRFPAECKIESFPTGLAMR
jgi:hypothetical protein